MIQVPLFILFERNVMLGQRFGLHSMVRLFNLLLSQLEPNPVGSLGSDLVLGAEFLLLFNGNCRMQTQESVASFPFDISLQSGQTIFFDPGNEPVFSGKFNRLNIDIRLEMMC